MAQATHALVLTFVYLALQVVLLRACIHDQLDHRMTSNEQTYSDDHPFLRGQRRRSLRAMDEVKFQEYNRDIGETVAANVYKPIRITPYYDDDTVDLLPPGKRDLLKKIISNAIRRFKLTLQVVPVQGNLSAQHGCDTQWITTPIVCQTILKNEMCLEMSIPSSHFGATKVCTTCTSTGCATGSCTYTSGKGIADTDFLLYVRAANSSYCTGDVLAYATSCQKDQFDRPTFGMANFCPSQLDLDPLMYETQLAVAMHEMSHALGFSSRMFAYMRKPDGTPRTPRDSRGNPPTYLSTTCTNGNTASVFVKPAQSTVKFSTERNHVVAKLVTPHVAEFVQAHFNCSSLAGAELESQDSGCMGSHWEERLFEPEYMSPVASFRNIFSGLTLAFFEDSGWYRTNLSMASRMHFGEKQGCSFAQGKCIDPSTTQSIAPNHYCTSKGVESCSVDATSRSLCGISTGSSIPPYYQYFQKDPSEGATNSFSDFCPINTGFSGGDCTNTDNLSVPKGTTLNILGETYCPTCKCTATTLRSKDSTSWSVNARRQTGCYAMRCSDNQTVEITLPSSSKAKSVTTSVTCATPGSQVAVPGFTGMLTCPDPFVVCASQCPNACSGNGMCDFATSTCVCENGWIGSDCATDASFKSMVTSSSSSNWNLIMLVIAAFVTLACF